MAMPDVPKRALAAPSSLQRSKFTLAPRGRGCVSIFKRLREEGGWCAAYLRNWYLEGLLDRTGCWRVVVSHKFFHGSEQEVGVVDTYVLLVT